MPKEDRPDIKPDIPQLRALEGGSESTPPKQGHLKSAPDGGGGGNSGGLYSPSEVKDAEEGADSGYYNAGGDKRRLARFRSGSGSKPNYLKRSRTWITIVSLVVGGVTTLATFFFLGIFNLPNFMKNIEQAGFQRYQVDLNGRSSKWLAAYMTLRFGEVDDPNLAVKDRDNIFFRADSVDNNQPLRDWYRTLRTSNFEENLFNDKGIRFTTVAYKDGNIIKFRPAIIKFQDTDRQITFDPGQATFDALARGDPNAFNGTLQDFVAISERFETDREARAAIKEIVRQQEPNWWKAVKRYHVRQDIQNMIGVRKWTFFENKRNAAREKTISVRNKIITQALPEDSKTGAFIKCLFGVPDCKASSDPADPVNTEPTPTGANKQTGDKTDGNPNGPKPVGDGSGDTVLSEAAGTQAAGEAGDMAGKILTKIVSRAGLFSLLDSLARFDEAIHNSTFSKIVAQAKAQHVAGLFTVFGVAADQLTTGQQSGSEVNAFMQQFKHGTGSEGWTTVVDPENSSNKASAASNDYVKAKNKAQFCSDAHQAEMKKHPRQADKEFQWLCPKNRVGGVNNAKELEDAWNNGIGIAIHPILSVYHKATGGIFDIFNDVVGAITDPIISATLAATGTEDDVNHVVAAAGAKALELGGATSNINDETPSGQIANDILQGSSVMGEASMRNQGGIPSTAQTAAETQKNLAAYQADQRHNSLFTRYLSPSNPKSLFATQAFAITSGLNNLGKNLLGIFGNAISNPLRALTQPTHAAVPDGYGACKFTGIQCMDMPKECLNPPALSMTPQNSTNADELGYFKPEDLSWDLMNSKDAWYEALYEKVGGDDEKALKVYNCALFDNTARSGISAQYGYAGENALKNEGNPAESDVSDSGTVSGDAQQLAQEILDNKNIDLSAGNFCRYCEEDIKNMAQGKPAYGSVQIDINILKFLVDLGNHAHVDVNSITGEGSGHSSGSKHYTGNAIDFGCPVDPIADSIAKKYGLMAENETCGNTHHAHYSKDGF